MHTHAPTHTHTHKYTHTHTHTHSQTMTKLMFQCGKSCRHKDANSIISVYKVNVVVVVKEGEL